MRSAQATDLRIRVREMIDGRKRSGGVALSLLRPWDQLSARLLPDFIKHIYYIGHINDSDWVQFAQFFVG